MRKAESGAFVAGVPLNKEMSEKEMPTRVSRCQPHLDSRWHQRHTNGSREDGSQIRGKTRRSDILTCLRTSDQRTRFLNTLLP